jgi:hypothetical protein
LRVVAELVAVRFQASGLSGTDFVDRFVHLGHDVVTVQNVQGLASPCMDRVQVRLPHVAADELQRRQDLVSEQVEEGFQGGFRPVLPHPQ